MAGVEFVTGAEAQDRTGEPHAAASAQPDNQQAITCCFAIEYLDGRGPHHRPARRVRLLARLRPRAEARLAGTPARPDTTRPDHAQARQPRLRPARRGAGLWVYRRILDPRNFRPGAYPGSSGITLVNWPQNDYWLGPLVGPDVIAAAGATQHVARAKQLSLSLLYWLQTECPRPDGKIGWKGLRLRPDLVGTEDGLAKAPYIRESRRIQAEFTVRRAARRHRGPREPRPSRQDVQAERSPTASASAATGSTCTRAPAATTTSTSARCRSRSRSARFIPPPGREPAAGLQEPGDDPHHQRLLPAASGRVGHRRGRRRARGVLPRAEGDPAVRNTAKLWRRFKRGSSARRGD